MKVKVGQRLYFANIDMTNPQIAEVEVEDVSDERIRVVAKKVLVGDKADFDASGGGLASFSIYAGDNWQRLFKDLGKAKQALIKLALKEEKDLEKTKREDLRNITRDYEFNAKGIDKDYAGAVKAVRKLLSKLQD